MTEDFIVNGTMEEHCCYIVEVVYKITNMHLLTVDSLKKRKGVDFITVVGEIFLKRPMMINKGKVKSEFAEHLSVVDDFYQKQKEYLDGFDKIKYQKITDHTTHLI